MCVFNLITRNGSVVPLAQLAYLMMVLRPFRPLCFPNADPSIKCPSPCLWVLLLRVCGWLCLPAPLPGFLTSSSSSSSLSAAALSLLRSNCIQQIVESVNHCHINGIVHRDLKVSQDSKTKQTWACSPSVLLPWPPLPRSADLLTFGRVPPLSI